MTDDRLRALERRFRETGTVEDEAAWLRARLQAGELEQSKLELAAYCSQEAAATALGEARARALPDGLRGWVEGLATWGREPTVRAAIAAARSFLPPPSLPGVELQRHAHALVAVEEAEGWACCPCEECRQRVARVVDGLLLYSDVHPPQTEGEQALGVAYNVARTVLPAPDDHYLTDDQFRAAVATEACMGVAADLVRVEQAVQAELIPWALGYRDPVRDRVEARKAAGE